MESHAAAGPGSQFHIELVDDYRLTQPGKVITLTLMTPCAADVSTRGEIKLPMLSSAPIAVAYDHQVFHAVVEPIPIDDEQLRHSWGERLYRITPPRPSCRLLSQSGRCESPDSSGCSSWPSNIPQYTA